MKNVSIALNVVLIIAVGFLYYLQFSKSESKPQEQNVQTERTETNSENLRVAYIEMDSLLTNYKYYKELQELMLSKRKQAEDNLSTKQKQLEKKAIKFQEQVQKQLVTRREAEEMDNQLMQEQQNLMQLKDKLSYQLLSDEQVLNRKIYDSILSFLDDYNKRYNFHMILTNTGASTLIYGDPQFNITTEVINGVNSRYEGSKKDNK